MRRKGSSSVWAMLLTVFLGVAAAAIALPGCGDDSGNDSRRLEPR